MAQTIQSTLPTKRIVSKAHLDAWLDSPTHADVVRFVEQLNQSVVGVKLTDTVEESQAVSALVSVLDQVEQIYHDTPPVDNGKSRFGNPAFRDFYDKVAARAPELHARIPGLDSAYVNELCVYFCESWGNRTRVDYGSGMELNFICWLLCLQKLGVISEEDSKAIVIKVFWKYMRIARLLQSGYWLEPAGSHGAQGLDDYHFAVFIFGSAQLRDHKYLRPKCIHDNEILDEFAKDYMYLSYVRYINSIKTASLRWHSPMLDDISGVRQWAKVNDGMLKMYRAEVLAKLPVAQHFLFGALLPYPDAPELEAHHEESDVHVDSHGHLHVRGESEFSSCCGIAIPSGFAAAQAAKEAAGGAGGLRSVGDQAGVRRIPFD
ncbi:peptidylprolyl isomerase RRD2 [Rhodotorula paludigena]|uniref:peptidylprolyl isomerase RRD2 n=1 Tax=Rhodotorula paludigena TaxID=86838 RepID=UPI0031741C72